VNAPDSYPDLSEPKLSESDDKSFMLGQDLDSVQYD
jgi:hypothetical protein